LEDLDVAGRIILKWFLKNSMGWCGVDWICVSQDREKWWAFVNIVMNLKLP
jgi:hypothetical protein